MATPPIDPPAWVADTVFYQVFPDRLARSGRVAAPGPLEAWDAPPTPFGFKGGDLYGVADRLDDLADLGIGGLYLNPIFTAASNHRYNASDYLSVDPLLGGDAALRELLDAAHARGIRVVLDGVFNHAGRGFFPFQHVLEAGCGRRTATGSTSIRTSSRARAAIDAYRPREPRAAPAAPATARGGTCRRCRSSGSSTRRCASSCSASPSTGSGSGSTAGGSTSRPTSSDPTFWPEFRRRVRAVRPRRLPRRRDLGRVARVAARRPVRRADELPARDGDPRLRERRPARPGRDRRPDATTGGSSSRSTGRPSATGSTRLLDAPRSRP